MHVSEHLVRHKACLHQNHSDSVNLGLIRMHSAYNIEKGYFAARRYLCWLCEDQCGVASDTD